jgi:hypothetical protein
MNGRSRYFFDTFGVCSEAGDVVAVRLDLDFRDLEDRDDLEDCEGSGVVTGRESGMEMGVSFDDAEGSLCADNRGDSTVLEGQSIWGLTRSSQGIPKMIE